MEDLSPEISKEILQVIRFSYVNQDQRLLRHQILDLLSKRFHAESLVFFQVDENFRITETILKDLCEKKSADYGKHYCLMDPFKLVQKYDYRMNVIALEELVERKSFLSTEYYNDFYKPQNIHYKMVVNLGTKHRLFGTICMHRSIQKQNFTQQEIRILKAMSPYLVHALEQNELYKKIKTQTNLFKIIENNWTVGIIILDESFRVLHVNDRARDACQKMAEGPVKREGQVSTPPILHELLKECRDINEKFKQHQSESLLFPREKIIRGRKSEEYAVAIQIICNAVGFEDHRLFMISIEERQTPFAICQRAFTNSCQLTSREVEIARLVFRGLTNAEIANNLYVSEITVKWHIRNIFKKTGVKNRSALITRLLDRDIAYAK